MANFDFLENITELQPLYAHCREAENFQLVRPEQSVVGARKALEYWVKLVYLTNGWDMPQHAGLMELVSNTDFIDYIGDAQIMDIYPFHPPYRQSRCAWSEDQQTRVVALPRMLARARRRVAHARRCYRGHAAL